MGEKENAEIKAWGTRPAQSRANSGSCHHGSERGVREDCRQHESLNLGADRTSGPGGIDNSLIIGGIIQALKDDVEERLREVDECVEWYQREKVKHERRLAQLESLERLSKNNPND
ncbi:MAG: hypothetical protein AAGA75_14235 [Cyanobacteria bacterium P01_E01_bin.6]